MSVSAATAGAGLSTGAALLGRLPPVSVPHVSLIQADCTTHPLLATFNANPPQKPGEQQKSSRCRDNFQAFFCRCLKKFFTFAVTTNPKDQLLTQVFSVFMLRFRTEGFQGLFAAFGWPLTAPPFALSGLANARWKLYRAALFQCVPLVMAYRPYLGWLSFRQVITVRCRWSGSGPQLLRFQICWRGALFSELPSGTGKYGWRTRTSFFKVLK